MSQPELLSKLFENDGAGPNLRSDIIPAASGGSSERYTEISFGGDWVLNKDELPGKLGTYGICTSMLIPPDAKTLVLCSLAITYLEPLSESIPPDPYTLRIYRYNDEATMSESSSIYIGQDSIGDGDDPLVYLNDEIYGDLGSHDGTLNIDLSAYAGVACTIAFGCGYADWKSAVAYATVRIVY